jgi:hypothetical protein
MDSADDVYAHIHRLHESVWELAAIALALRDPATTDPDQRRAAEDVLVAAGLLEVTPTGVRPAPGLSQATGDDSTNLAAQASTGILQAAGFLAGANAWTTQDDEALLAQGRASAQAARAFQAFAVPAMDGMADLLAGPTPVMLDVGVGVAAMAVAYCQAFPRLRVVGLDVFPRALDLARRTISDAAMTERIELRHQDVATLDDCNRFCLAWLPAPFVPRAALEAGLPLLARSLVPGGWLAVGHGKFDASGLSDALTRLQTVAYGGTPLSGDGAQALLRGAGLQQVTTFPTPEGAPGITIGRRSPDA